MSQKRNRRQLALIVYGIESAHFRGFAGGAERQEFMSGSIKMTCVALALLGASSANAAEVAPASDAPVPAHVAQSEPSSAVILAEGQRQTNLLKTATSVSVLGIDGDQRQHSSR